MKNGILGLICFSSIMFTVYTSSAGSGKTYTLTKEYLKLALGTDTSINEFNPTYFRRILAITFTKDAAQEMKARVLSKLLAFIQKQDLDLQNQIAKDLDISLEELQNRAKATFEQIIYHYSDFAISTIDSFTNRLVSAFTQELNVPLNYELDMDTDTLTANAADGLIAQVGIEDKEQITNFLLKFVIDEIDNGTYWKDIHRKLADFTKDLYKEESRPIARQLGQTQLSQYESCINDLKKFIDDVETFLSEKAKAFKQIIQKKGLDFKDFYQGDRGLGGFINRMIDKKMEEKMPNNYVLEILEEDKWYSNPKKNPKSSILDDVIPELKPLLSEICLRWQKDKNTYFLIKETINDFYKVALTGEIHQAVEEFKIQNNIVYISETNEKIAKIVQNEPVPFIYERLGERYNHLLIDEFQDTSILQWHNLLPLAENNLAEGNLNLIVGDAKQAIYRWRGGEMEQIVHLAYANDPLKGDTSVAKLQEIAAVHFQDQAEAADLLADRYLTIRSYVERKNLATNFRSDSEIVEFNNAFFHLIKELKKNEVPFIEQVYDEQFAQKLPENTVKNGCVEIILNPQEKEGKNYEELTKNEVLRAIEDAQAKGFGLRDIAILFRNKKKAIQIATLLKEKGFNIISVDSLVISADEKVNFLMAMLKVIANPENSLAKSEALYLFHKTIMKNAGSQEQNEAIRKAVYEKNASLNNFLELFAEKGYSIDYGYLQSLSLYEMTEELLRIFRILQEHPTRLEFIFKFLDWIIEFERQKKHHLDDFIDEWNKKKHNIAVDIPADTDAITITTIHKSKGLEYPVVILPFADWSTKADYRNSIWMDSNLFDLPVQKQQKPSHLLVRMKKSSVPVITEHQKEEDNKNILENLNLLYVALTRPINLLYIIGKAPNKHTTYENSVSRWLNMFIENLAVAENNYASHLSFQEDGHIYRFGHFDKNLRKVHPKEEKETFILKNLKTVRLKKKLK
jgi:ATP-dependent exoDNAse (exonuclease V) beta subunit